MENFNTKLLTQLFNRVLETLDDDMIKEIESIHNTGLTNISPHFLSGRILGAIQQEGKLFGFGEVGDYSFEATPLQSALFSLFINTYTPTGFHLEDISEELEPTNFIVGSQEKMLPFVGGSRQGSLDDVTYNEIKNKFGHPTYDEPSSDEKVQAEWDIMFDNGVRASIYDYKQYHLPPEDVTDWSVGGNSPHSAYEVYKVMGIL
jgi:hypothetical protein